MTERFWFLSQLFVRPDAQARGIGQALLSKTLMQAERNSATNRALITPAYNIASTGLYPNNGLSPREPLYRMAAPAHTVEQNLTHTDYDVTLIPPWPAPRGWMAEIDEALLGFRRDLRQISARRHRGARGSNRASRRHRGLCLHLRPWPFRPTGDPTGR